MEYAIEVEHLKKSYGNLLAVNDISFNVKKGSLFAFLGENGAGKSTTINVLCSILKKDGGTVRIDGHDLDAENEQTKKSVGIVFQNSVLDKCLNVLQNLKARIALYGLEASESKSRIDEIVALLGLEEVMKRPYGKLSGGQRRRVDIARGLLGKPRVLFLDEPTTGLDPQSRRTVWDVIEKLQLRDGLTVFLTTHYMEEAASADDVVILDRGIIAAQGSPEELKTRYAGDVLRILRERDADFEKTLGGREFIFKNGAYVLNMEGFEALDFVKAHKKDISDFEIVKGTMDDVFLNVTGREAEGSDEF